MSVLLIDCYGDRIKYGRNPLAKLKLHILLGQTALFTKQVDMSVKQVRLLWLVWT